MGELAGLGECDLQLSVVGRRGVVREDWVVLEGGVLGHAHGGLARE